MQVPAAIIEGERDGCCELKASRRRAKHRIVVQVPVHGSAPGRSASRSGTHDVTHVSGRTQRTGGGCRPLRAAMLNCTGFGNEKALHVCAAGPRAPMVGLIT